MADPSSMLPKAQVLAQLRQLAASQKTGTLFIATSDNHSALLSLQEGRIMSMSYGPHQGMDALEAFQSITAASYRFDPKLFVPLADDQALPPTAQLLDFLDGESGSTAIPARKVTTLPLAELRDAVSEEATEYFGPVGPALCNEHFQALAPTDGETLAVVVQRIAAELGDERLGKEFESKAMRRINRILS